MEENQENHQAEGEVDVDTTLSLGPLPLPLAAAAAHHHPQAALPPGWFDGAEADGVDTNLTLVPYVIPSIPRSVFARATAEAVGGIGNTIRFIGSKKLAYSDTAANVRLRFKDESKNTLLGFLDGEELLAIDADDGLPVTGFDLLQPREYPQLRLTRRDTQGLCMTNWKQVVDDNVVVPGQFVDIWGFRRGAHHPPAFIFAFRVPR